MYLELLKSFEPLSNETLSNKEDPFVGMNYKLAPALFFQCIVHATDICDKYSMTRKGVELLEAAMKHNNETVKGQR